MELKAALAVAGNATLRRGFRFSKASNQKKNTTNHLLETMVPIPKTNGSGGLEVVSCTEEDGGVMRIKIVVKKSDLKQLVEVMSGIKGEAHRPTMPSVTVPSSTAEQRLNLLLKKHLSRAKPLKGDPHKFWSPALQSIPEELCL